MINKSQAFIDLTLTPENAESRGYELLQDTFYDQEEPYFSRRQDELFYIKNKLILGRPAIGGDLWICYGLYRKIPKKTDSAHNLTNTHS